MDDIGDAGEEHPFHRECPKPPLALCGATRKVGQGVRNEKLTSSISILARALVPSRMSGCAVLERE